MQKTLEIGLLIRKKQKKVNVDQELTALQQQTAKE